jgi:hypothetical protein
MPEVISSRLRIAQLGSMVDTSMMKAIHSISDGLLLVRRASDFASCFLTHLFQNILWMMRPIVGQPCRSGKFTGPAPLGRDTPPTTTKPFNVWPVTNLFKNYSSFLAHQGKLSLA